MEQLDDILDNERLIHTADLDRDSPANYISKDYINPEKKPKYPNSPAKAPIFSTFLNTGRLDKLYELKVDPHIPTLSDKVVLDLGCGHGSAYIDYLKRTNPAKHFIHLDADEEVFARDSTYLPIPSEPDYYLLYDWEDDSKIVGDATSLPLSPDSIDIVHINMLTADNQRIDKDKLDAEVRRVIKSNGYVIQSAYDVLEGSGFERLGDTYSPSVLHFRE